MGSLVPKRLPATEPVTLTEAKNFLRVDVTDDDALITDLITSARQLVEEFLNRTLVSQQWDLYLDAFPHVDGYAVTGEGSRTIGSLEQFPTGYSLLYPRSGPIYLPLPPVISIETLTYIDMTSATQSLTPVPSFGSSAGDYIQDLQYERARIMPAYGKYWPVTLPVPNCVHISYTCGYAGSLNGTASGRPLPLPIKQAICIALTDGYQLRGSTFAGSITTLKHFAAIKNILMPYRSWSIQ